MSASLPVDGPAAEVGLDPADEPAESSIIAVHFGTEHEGPTP